MNYFKEVLDYLSKIFQWWIIVEPWEAGLRVRLGKRVKELSPGIYFRIPFIDACYVQETRLRMISLNSQTVTTRDSQTITIFSSIGYSINNIKKLYETIAQPDSTIANTVLGTIADYVATHEVKECSPETIEKTVKEKLSSFDYGIVFEHVKITGYSIVKTYRFITDGSYVADGIMLTTKK